MILQIFSQIVINQQLKLALYKLANNGIVSEFCHLNNQWEISKKHINNYTQRVMYAFF